MLSRPFRIVIADDEADMLRYYQTTLTSLGHDVIAQAENGQQLVEHCRTMQPELVISDIIMPELDGLSAMERVQTQYAIPFILVTAYFDKQSLERARKHNVLSYLVKPIKRAHLVSALAVAGKVVGLP